MNVNGEPNSERNTADRKMAWRARLEIAGGLLLAVGIVVFAWQSREEGPDDIPREKPVVSEEKETDTKETAQPVDVTKHAGYRKNKSQPVPTDTSETPDTNDRRDVTKRPPADQNVRQDRGNFGRTTAIPTRGVDDYAPDIDFLLEQARRELDEGDPVTAALLALEILPRDGVDLTMDDWAAKPYLKSVYHLLYQAYFAQREQRVLKGHLAFVRAVAFSSDGRRIVTASSDQTARIWDAGTGALVAELEGHKREVWSAAFSPDGNRVMTVSFDNTARLWAAETGEEIAVLRGHAGEVAAVAFNRAGTRVATASYDNTARIWNAETGDEIAILSGHTARIRAVAFNPVSQDVVTASDDGTARIWNTQSGALKTVLKGHEGSIRRAFFSPDGRRVVTASADGTARIWASDTGRETAVLRGHSSYVSVAEFSPDSRQVVTAAWGDKLARVWDTDSGAEIAVLRGHYNWVNSAVFSPDGATILTASGDKTARLWDAGSGALLQIFGGHDNDVYTASYSPDGQTVLTGSGDGTARLWQASRSIHARDGNAVSMDSQSLDHYAVSKAGARAVLRNESLGVDITLPDDAVQAVGLNPDAYSVVVTGRMTNVYRLFPRPNDLVVHWRTSAPRNLTRDQRLAYSLFP